MKKKILMTTLTLGLFAAACPAPAADTMMDDPKKMELMKQGLDDMDKAMAMMKKAMAQKDEAMAREAREMARKALEEWNRGDPMKGF